jgi:hypothetical protein
MDRRASCRAVNSDLGSRDPLLAAHVSFEALAARRSTEAAVVVLEPGTAAAVGESPAARIDPAIGDRPSGSLDGRYAVEPVPEGSRVTLNPRPEVRGIGRIMEPIITFMGRRLNREHLSALRRELESQSITSS